MSWLWLLLVFPAWTLGWWAYYLIFDSKHDASGDGGIAVLFISLIWIAGPMMIFQNLFRKKK